MAQATPWKARWPGQRPTVKVCSGCIAPTSAPESVAADSTSRGSAPEQWTTDCPARHRRDAATSADGIVGDGEEDGVAPVRHILRRDSIAAGNLGGEVFGGGGRTAGDSADTVAASVHRPRKGGANSARADEADVAEKLSRWSCLSSRSAGSGTRRAHAAGVRGKRESERRRRGHADPRGQRLGLPEPYRHLSQVGVATMIPHRASVSTGRGNWAGGSTADGPTSVPIGR